MGRTSQRLQQWIKQHVPKTIFQEHISQDRSTLVRSCKPIRSCKAETFFLLLDNTSYKALHAHVNIMITNFLFLPVAVLLFIFPPLKPRTSKHPNQIYALFFVLFYLPYLSSIHEKANCIAILWTVSPHSLGSCLFRGLWVTCLPHEGGASR